MERALTEHLNKKIIFFGGKGGVGKTTAASAFALGASMVGKKTLLVSTDPAHNTADIFRISLKTGEINQINRNLYALEIDSDKENQKYIDQVKEKLKQVVQPNMKEEINKQLELAKSSPGAEESALFDRIVDIMLEERKQYDLIVFDTAPTGHTIRLMTLPELMEVWTNSLLIKRKKVNELHQMWLSDQEEPKEDIIYKTLSRRKERFLNARNIVLDTKLTAFIFVLIPEKLPILETNKAVHTLKKHKIPVTSLIVNRILPEEEQSPFLKQRKRQEKIYLDEINATFKEESIHYIPMLDHDIYGVEHLQKIAKYLVAI